MDLFYEKDVDLRWKDMVVVSVVLVFEGYFEGYVKGILIGSLIFVEDGIVVFYVGMKKDGD